MYNFSFLQNELWTKITTQIEKIVISLLKRKKILAWDKNTHKKKLVSLAIYTNQNHQIAAPTIHKRAKNIPTYHLSSKCEKILFLIEISIHDKSNIMAHIYHQKDNVSLYTK